MSHQVGLYDWSACCEPEAAAFVAVSPLFCCVLATGCVSIHQPPRESVLFLPFSFSSFHHSLHHPSFPHHHKMFLSYLVSATLALSVNSFLIPGELDVSKADNTPALFNKEESLTLDCSSCPYALNSQRNGGHEWTNDVQSELHMKFETQDGQLLMNGESFFPLQLGSPPQLRVSQTKQENEDTTFEGYAGDLRLSYSLEYDEKKAEDGSSLISVVMQILAIDGQMVKIDDVEIKTIKSADGKVR